MRRSAVPFVAVLAVAALVGLLVYGVAATGDDTTLDQAVKTGQRPVAPDLELPVLGAGDDDDATTSLDAYRGKIVVLNFWASWCEPCRAEARVLERAQKQLAEDGSGAVLGVTFRDTEGDSEKFVAEHGLTYDSVRDVDGKLAEQYGTRALPETFVIDGAGRVVALSRGQADAAFLDRAIAAARQPQDR